MIVQQAIVTRAYIYTLQYKYILLVLNIRSLWHHEWFSTAIFTQGNILIISIVYHR